MSVLSKLLTILLMAVLLSACATQQEYWIDEVKVRLFAESYTVKKDDTLYSIAWLYELDYRNLAQWNNIKAPNYLIYPGQKLRLKAPESATLPVKIAPRKAVKPSGWQWPLDNPEVKQLPSSNAVFMKGTPSEAVHAVANGTVVYSGFNLKHYRGLIIIKHENDVFSVYGHNKEVFVAEKEQVESGQEIARLSDQQDDAKLYFELRQANKLLKLANYLPNIKVSISDVH